MSVSTLVTQVQYTATGSSPLAVPFPFTTASDLVVTSAEGVSLAFTVGGTPSAATGTVTLVAPVASQLLTIKRVMPLTQPARFGLQGIFSPKAHEAGFDRVTMQIQDEVAARQAAIAAVIASGATPENVGLSPVIATYGTAVRTVSDRFSDFANPMDFGAAGDGSTDDTDAVQACVDYCLSGGNYVAPKGMLVTHKHRLGSSVNIDRQINTPSAGPGSNDICRFRILGTGDQAGFHVTSSINMFSSTIAPIGTQPQAGGIVFQNLSLTADSYSRTAFVLAERFIRVAFVGCTFNLIGCYAHSTCFAQDMLWYHCTISACSPVFAASQGSYACRFIGCNAFELPGLFYSGTNAPGGNGTHGFAMIGNLVEGMTGYIATLSGTYGCTILGNHFESIQAANAFNLYGLNRNANISFVGNFIMLYAGPFIYCGPTDSIYSTGNYLTVNEDTLAGDQYLYGNADAVTDLVSVGDHCSAGYSAAISDATIISTLNGVTRSGTGRAMATGQFGFGIEAQAATRATFLGEDTSATKYAGTFLDANGNPIATFRNDKIVSMPGLPSYASNALALAGGLVAGDLYKTTGVVMVVT
jgi:hypothetical protein